MILFKRWQMYRDIPKILYWLEEYLGPSVLNLAYVSMYKGQLYLFIETRQGITYYSTGEGMKALTRDFVTSLPTLCPRWNIKVRDYGRLDLYGLRAECIYPQRKASA